MIEDTLASLSAETSREMEKMTPLRKKVASKPESLKRNFLAEDFHGKTPNIYETIFVISQRARQIGQKQARIIEQFLASRAKPDSEDSDDESPRKNFDEDDEDAPKLPKFEKPTILAMNEMYQGKIKYKVKE